MRNDGFVHTYEQMTQITEAASNVSWYPHQYPGEVRGPFNRWFILQEGDDHGQGVLAHYSYDVQYAAMAMANFPALLARVKELEELLEIESVIKD